MRGLLSFLPLAISFLLLLSCGGICKDDSLYCPKSDNIRLLTKAFELGDYWVFENKANTMRDSIFVAEISGDLDKCTKLSKSCTILSNSSEIYLSGTIFSKELSNASLIYSIRNDGLDYDGIVFHFKPAIFSTEIGDIHFLNTEQIRTRYQESTSVQSVKDTTVGELELGNSIVLGGNIPLFDLELGFVQLVENGDTLLLKKSSNMSN